MRKSISIGAIVLLGISAIVGGLFFGLFSCGGYVWHKQLHTSLMIMASIFILFVPPKFLDALWKRLSFLVLSFVLFVVVRAAASAYYPASPENMSEFIQSFITGVQYGPC